MKKMDSLKMKIVLAEDNPDDAVLLMRLLEHSPFKVETVIFDNGEEVLSYLAQKKKNLAVDRAVDVSIIILDLNLPGKSGFETLKEIKSDPLLKQIPVIMLTASDDKNDVASTYKLGGTLFLQKPCGKEVLHEAIAQLRITGRLRY